MKQHLLLSFFIVSALLAYPQANTSYQFNGEQAVFTENRGQVVDMDGKPVPDVLAKASMPGLDMYLTKTGVTYILLQYTEDLTAKRHPVYINDKKFKVTYSRVDIALTGAIITNEQMKFTGDAGWQSNYYKTPDCKGQLAVQHFTNLTVQNVYPGIDWVWKFNAAGNLEYDFVVHAGADPSVIKMQYNYADLAQSKNKLLISTRIGSLTEGPLQARGTGKVQIAYNLEAKTKTISFAATGYDNTQDLTIDPPLALNWSAQFGGSFLNGLRGVATDNSGGVYLCGYTTSADFPTYNPHGGAYIDSTYNGQSDVILLKLDTNQNLKWATYMGGPGNDFANSVCYAPNSGKIFVTGGAASGFPVYANNTSNHGGQDLFAAAFNLSNLSIAYSGLFGGTGTDEGLKICVNNTTSQYYIVGYTDSAFAGIGGGGYFQSSVRGQEAVIMGFEDYNVYNPFYPTWSTKYGGSGDDYATCVTTDSLGDIIVGGYTTSANIPLHAGDSAYYQATNGGGNDGFILKFSTNTALVSASYYGGSGNDYINDVATGIKGNFVFTGRTSSANFPLMASGGFGFNQTHLADASDDAFIIKTDNNTALKWATYYGGNAQDVGTGIATDNTGQIYVSGFTFSTNFPLDSLTGAYWQPTNHGNADGFIARFTDLGIRSWSTYKGDSCYQYPYDLAFDKKFNKFYVAGEGLLACGQSLPDTGQIQNGVSSVGFCWGFNGAAAPPPVCTGFGIAVSQTRQPCPNQCNGAATVTPLGGHAPYRYAWSSGGSTATVNNICPNESWVEVEDSLGCSSEAILTWNPVSVTVNAGSIICNPGPATVAARASGGNGTHYTYSWSGTYPNKDSIQVSDTGTYTVTVTDLLACTASASGGVGYNNITPGDVLEVIDYPSCGYYYDGVITLDFTGTDSIYPHGSTIVWEDQNYNVLATGDTFYSASTQTTYFAVDSAYCFNGLTSPYYFQMYLYNTTDLATLIGTNPSTCISGDGQGSVSYSPQTFYIDGTAPNNTSFSTGTIIVDTFPNDTYYWIDGETAQTVTDLGIGTYFVMVTDNSCTTVLSTTLLLPQPQVSYTVDSAYCFGGEIDLYPYGGNGAPYYYQWPDGSTNDYEAQLNTGYYAITVTDQLYCADTVNLFLPQGTPLTANATSTPALCSGSDGTVTITGSAGAPPYLGTGIFAYPAGTYNISVTDNDGCTATAGATVTQPTAIVVTADSISGAACGGNATYLVSATGGTPPYTGTGTQFEPTGTDNITVTDANGCTGNTTVVVVHPNGSAIIPHNTYGPILCYGDTTTLTITATGGNGPITGTGVFIEIAGTYYFTISDSAGCSVVDTVVIEQPGQLSVSLYSAGITCAPGSVSATVTGGIPGYQFEWSTSNILGINSNINVTDSGTYSVTVQDFNGCTASASVFVNYNNLSSPSDSIIVYQYPSCGLSNGIIYINAPDPSKVSWVFPNGTIYYGDTVTNAPTNDVGTPVIVTDSANCFNGLISPVQYFIVLGPVGDTYLQSSNPTGCNTTDGEIWVSTSDNAWIYTNPSMSLSYSVINYAPLTYRWSNGDTYTMDSASTVNYYGTYNLNGISFLNPGSYQVTITDGSCKYVDSTVLIASNPQLVANYSATNLTCSGGNSGAVMLTGLANNVRGVIPNANYVWLYDTTYNFLWSNGDTTPSINHLTTGTYTVTITGPNACPVIDTFTLTVLHTITISDSITPPICYNSNATVTVSATGGTLPYTGTGNLFEAPGTQILTVTDANGCTAKDTITVPHGTGVQIIATNTYTPILCYGDTTTLTITATGGLGTITGTGTFAKPAGDYVITVTDSAGCSATDSIVITQPAMLSVNTQVDTIRCYGATGTVILTATGGTSPYTGTGTFAKPAGNFVFAVTDANGCAVNDTVNLTQPTRLTLTDTATQVNCFGGHATVILTAIGGTGPYTGTGTLLEPAGNDLLVVSDQNGCKDSVNLDITQPSPINITVQLPDSNLHCADSIRAIITATGGSGNYTGTGSITYTQSGNYTINITDGHGCQVDTTVHITLDTCTGIDNVFANTGVMVYPNPASDMFYVKFLAPLNTPADVRLYAVDGKLVMLKTLGAGTDLTEMDCNQLASGVYILRTVVEEREYNFKVVVTR